VIDSRQSYLQDVVVAGLRALGFNEQADNSIHFSYEMVALSPRTCVEMGVELSEEDKRRPYVEVSGRKGLGVKADDLIDKLIEKALDEVTSRHADEPEESRRKAATQIAVAALRYFMLKYTRNSVIAFDFGEAHRCFDVIRAVSYLGRYREAYENNRASLGPNVIANYEIGAAMSLAALSLAPRSSRINMRARSAVAAANRSLAKALAVLKDMKAAGRTWNEMAERVEREFETKLDKEQLKALVRE